MKTIKTNYFYGHEVSEYGKASGYVDYGTLATALEMVRCNDITKLFYNTIGNEYIEPEQVSGYIDNSEAIEEMREELEFIEDEQIEMISNDLENTARYKELEARADELNEKIEELEREQDEPREIFQYYIISDYSAEILKDWTNEIIYYIPVLDIYVWGVTHFGTSWDYVLTDIKIEGDAENA